MKSFAVLFGDRVATRRSQLRITQQELADVLGVNSHTVSRWELGHYLPNLSELVKIANALDTTPSALLGGEVTELRPTPRDALLELSTFVAKTEMVPHDILRELHNLGGAHWKAIRAVIFGELQGIGLLDEDELQSVRALITASRSRREGAQPQPIRDKQRPSQTRHRKPVTRVKRG